MDSEHGIDPRLLADSHCLGHLASGQLLLSRNTTLHWFILVPQTREADVLDLPSDQLTTVMADCASVGAFLKQQLAYPKVNFAGLGNVVPQMHLHIIGRRETDPCWPAPVWGNLPVGPDYSAGELARLRTSLAQHCHLGVAS